MKPRPKKPRPAAKKGRGGARKNSGGRRAGAGRKPGERRLKDFEELGNAPADELAAAKWAFDALAISLRQVMTDGRLSDVLRRAEIRTISRAMNALLPRARLRKAEQLVRGAASREATTQADPELEAAPPAPARARPEPPPIPDLEPVPKRRG